MIPGKYIKSLLASRAVDNEASIPLLEIGAWITLSIDINALVFSVPYLAVILWDVPIPTEVKSNATTGLDRASAAEAQSWISLSSFLATNTLSGIYVTVAPIPGK